MTDERREVMRKTDKLIWTILCGACAIIILGGGAWTNSINSKVDKIASLESNIQYIQKDIAEIKNLIKESTKRGD